MRGLTSKLFGALLVTTVAAGIAMVGSSSASAYITTSECGTVKGYGVVTLPNVYPSISESHPYYATQARGNKNNCVKAIQQELNTDYCSPSTKLVEDGSFGALTERAVSRYQQMVRNANFRVNGSAISVDGRVGPQTYSLLNFGGGTAVFIPAYSC